MGKKMYNDKGENSPRRITVYEPKNKASKSRRQKLIELKGEIQTSTIIGRKSNTPFSIINRTN